MNIFSINSLSSHSNSRAASLWVKPFALFALSNISFINSLLSLFAFAPLYLSNYCVNGCIYCPYHAKNKEIARKKLTQEEIKREVIALQDLGQKGLH